MNPNPPRVVLDTNVIFEGLTKSNRASGLLIEAWQAELLQVCISDALWYEYEDVLFRLLSFERWNRVKPILDTLVQRAQMVTVFYTWRPMSADNGDDHVIDCAMNAKALLITSNLKDFRQAELQLGLRVMAPAIFVAKLLGA